MLTITAAQYRRFEHLAFPDGPGCEWAAAILGGGLPDGLARVVALTLANDASQAQWGQP